MGATEDFEKGSDIVLKESSGSHMQEWRPGNEPVM